MKSSTNEGTVVPVLGQLSLNHSGRSTPAQRLGQFLRRRHPFKTAVAVEAVAGVSEEAVKKLLSRGSMPSFATMGKLLACYGPELLAEAMENPPAWLLRAAEEQQPERSRD